MVHVPTNEKAVSLNLHRYSTVEVCRMDANDVDGRGLHNRPLAHSIVHLLTQSSTYLQSSTFYHYLSCFKNTHLSCFKHSSQLL
jgi:hypothetical protein